MTIISTPCARFWLILAAFAWCSLFAGCASVDSLRTYDKDLVVGYLQSYGFQNPRGLDMHIEHHWQDAEGRTAYFAGLTSGLRIVRAESERPLHVSGLRPFGWWIDAEGEVHNLPPFAYPYDAAATNVSTEIDKQSGYFLQKVHATGTVYVGHFTRGHAWLFTFQCPEKFRPDQICAVGETIYVLDHQNRFMHAFAHWTKNCLAFAPDPVSAKQYRKVDEFRLAGRVEAVDPTGPRFLCSGYGSMPIPGSRFVFDVEKKKTVKEIGWKPLAFFFPDDWLTERLQRGGHMRSAVEN